MGDRPERQEARTGNGTRAGAMEEAGWQDLSDKRVSHSPASLTLTLTSCGLGQSGWKVGQVLTRKAREAPHGVWSLLWQDGEGLLEGVHPAEGGWCCRREGSGNPLSLPWRRGWEQPGRRQVSV